MTENSPSRRHAYNPYTSAADAAAPSSSMSIMDLLAKDFQVVSDKFKMEDEDMISSSPFSHLEKAKILQDARIFHDSILVRENPRKCCTVMTQILHLQHASDTRQRLNTNEATEVFFGVTKLFMSEDSALRRMVYLFIKEMSSSCDPSDVIIVTSCLTKDMTCDVDLYRANALRVLSRIVDAAMLGNIERYVKQAIVDSSAQVSNAALVSASNLYKKNSECAGVIKRWVTETTEAMKSPNRMVQYNALHLMYQIKKHDRLGVSKLVTQIGQRKLKSPLANVLLVRYTAKLIHDEYADGRDKESSNLSKFAHEYLFSALRHRSSLVKFDAARAICGLPSVEPNELVPAVTVLQAFLSSVKPAAKFASISTLARIAECYPRVVSKCNEDLEALLQDENRTIATLAMTTLLKSGSENSIDRLLQQLQSFLEDLNDDEAKIAVVQSIQQLCLTYPAKHRMLVAFLSNILRDMGGFPFKRAIVSAIIALMNEVPETIETSLFELCEFIEDCEFAMLSTRILGLLGEMGPRTSRPSRFIRYIYNRVILEKAGIRACAITTLGKFAAGVPSLRESVLSLIKRSLYDVDDETRDRAAIAVSVITAAMEENPYTPPPDDEDSPYHQSPPETSPPNDSAAFLFQQELPMSFDNLTQSIHAYVSTPDAMESAEVLTFDSLPIIEEDAYPTEESTNINGGKHDGLTSLTSSGSMNGMNGKKRDKIDPAAVIYSTPELAQFGRVFRSSPSIELTESETEYVVTCIKHIFPENVVLQFKVQNTIEDQRLDNVRVSIESDDDDENSELFELVGEIAVESIGYGQTENCFVVLRRNTKESLAPTIFSAELHFSAVSVDPSTGEEIGDSFDEEYALEDLEISNADFMAKVSVGDFRRSWEEMGSDLEVLEKFGLSFKNLEAAVLAVVEFLNMHVCDGTSVIKSSSIQGTKPHMLHLSGVFVGGCQVLARAQFVLDSNSGVVLKIAVRSGDAGVSRLVADCIR